MDGQERQLLEAFVVENRDLEQLEALLAEFNMFEALGAVRQELRHSDFLSFLLDPSQNHGLGDVLLKRFLKRVLAGSSDPPFSPIEIDVADLRSATVLREWRQVDILIQDPVNDLVVAIENKIFSGEHSDQLRRYRSTVAREFRGFRAILIFLTPEGDKPSDDAYIPFDYGSLAELLEDVHQAHETTLGPDVGTLLGHYIAMLRRHIVSDSEIANLCQKIYRRHKQALDLIFEQRPDLQADLTELLKTLVTGSAEQHGLALDHSSKTYAKFAVVDWDKYPAQHTGKGWTRSGRVLLFEFRSAPDQLLLNLYIGPGPGTLRRQLHRFALEHKSVFGASRARLNANWAAIYRRQFISKVDYEDPDREALMEQTRAQWEEFLGSDLPRIREAMRTFQWPDLPEVE